MTKRISLEVRGLAGCIANLHKTDLSIKVDIRREARASSARIFRNTQAWCAYDTGFMHDHLREDFSRDGLAFRVGWDARDFLAAGLPFYPPFPELGTIHMAAQPALLPAYHLEEPRFRTNITRAVRAAIARNARGVSRVARRLS